MVMADNVRDNDTFEQYKSDRKKSSKFISPKMVAM